MVDGSQGTQGNAPKDNKPIPSPVKQAREGALEMPGGEKVSMSSLFEGAASNFVEKHKPTEVPQPGAPPALDSETVIPKPGEPVIEPGAPTPEPETPSQTPETPATPATVKIGDAELTPEAAEAIYAAYQNQETIKQQLAAQAQDVRQGSEEIQRMYTEAQQMMAEAQAKEQQVSAYQQYLMTQGVESGDPMSQHMQTQFQNQPPQQQQPAQNAMSPAQVREMIRQEQATQREGYVRQNFRSWIEAEIERHPILKDRAEDYAIAIAGRVDMDLTKNGINPQQVFQQSDHQLQTFIRQHTAALAEKENKLKSPMTINAEDAVASHQQAKGILPPQPRATGTALPEQPQAMRFDMNSIGELWQQSGGRTAKFMEQALDRMAQRDAEIERLNKKI